MERTCGNVGWCVSSLPWKEQARQYIRSWSPGHSLFLDHHWGQVWRRGSGGMLGDVCPLFLLSLPWGGQARQYIITWALSLSWSSLRPGVAERSWRNVGWRVSSVSAVSPMRGAAGRPGQAFLLFPWHCRVSANMAGSWHSLPRAPWSPEPCQGGIFWQELRRKKNVLIEQKIDEKCCYFCSIGNFKDKFVQLFSAQNAFFQFYCKIFTTAQCSVAADRTRWQICGGDYHESGITPSGYSIITPDRVLSREWQNSQRI